MSVINPQLLKPFVITEGKHSDLFNKSVKKLLKPTVTLPSQIEEDVYKEATKLVNSGENLDIISTDIKGAMGTPIALAAAVRSFPTVDYLLKNGATPIVSLPPSLLPESLEATAASKQIQEQMSKTQELRSKILSDGEQAQKNFSENKNPESAESFKVFQNLAEGGYNLNAPFFNGEDGESKFLIGRSAAFFMPTATRYLMKQGADPKLDKVMLKNLEEMSELFKKRENTEDITSDQTRTLMGCDNLNGIIQKGITRQQDLKERDGLKWRKQFRIQQAEKVQQALKELGITDIVKESKADRRKREAAEFRAKRAEELKNQSKAEESAQKTRSRSVSSTSSRTLEHEPSPKASPAHSPVRKSPTSVFSSNPLSSPAQSSMISNTEPGWEVTPRRDQRRNRGGENIQPQAQPPRRGISSRGSTNNRASVRGGLRGASNVAPRGRGIGTTTIESERRSVSNTTGRGRGTINTSTHRPDMRTRNLRQHIQPNQQPFLQQPGFVSTSSTSPNPARPLPSVSKKTKTPATATPPIGGSFLNRSPGNQSPIRTSIEPAPPNTLTLRPKASSSLETARIPNAAQSNVESSSAISAPGRVSPPRKSTPPTQPQTPAHDTPSPAVVSSTRLQSPTRGRRTRSPLASQKPKQKMGFGDFEVEIDTTKSTSKIVKERSSSPRKSNLPKMAFGDFEVEMDSANKQSRVVGERRRSRSPKKLNPNANAFKP